MQLIAGKEIFMTILIPLSIQPWYKITFFITYFMAIGACRVAKVLILSAESTWRSTADQIFFFLICYLKTLSAEIPPMLYLSVGNGCRSKWRTEQALVYAHIQLF